MKRILLRWFCCFMAALCLFPISAMAEPDWPADTSIGAEAGIVIDADTNTVLFEKNSDETYPPASITKLLTALIVLENCELDETVLYSENAMNSLEADSGNKLSLQIGDQLSVEDSLYAMLLISSNQSANALAEHTAGSIPAFVDMMNARIAELGCTRSHFENPSGLNGDTQVVTAREMALIAQAAFNNEKLLKISSTIRYKLGPTIHYPEGVTVSNEHKLVYTTDTSSPNYCPSAVAGKTGYLIKAGNTLVTYAVQGNQRLISVILKGTKTQYFIDGKALLDFGFQNFRNIPVADQEQRYVTGEEAISLNGVSYQPSGLHIESGRMITLPKSAAFEDASLTLGELPTDAPGHAVAQLCYTYGGHDVGKAYLNAGGAGLEINGVSATAPPDAEQAPVPAETKPGRMSLFSQLPVSTLLPVLLCAFVLLLLTGIFSLIIYSRKKEEKAQALRRQRRRQRLRSEGEDVQAEFDRLMKERWKR